MIVKEVVSGLFPIDSFDVVTPSFVTLEDQLPLPHYHRHPVLDELNLERVPGHILQQFCFPLSWYAKPPDQRNEFGVHEPDHPLRVTAYANLMMQDHFRWRNNTVDPFVVYTTTGSHDIRRTTDLEQNEHGLWAAEYILVRPELDHATQAQRELIYFVNNYHAYPDQTSPHKPLELVILEEADLLDRFRGDNDLNLKFIRLPITYALLPLAQDFVRGCQLHPEIRKNPLKAVLEVGSYLGIVKLEGSYALG